MKTGKRINQMNGFCFIDKISNPRSYADDYDVKIQTSEVHGSTHKIV